MTGTQAPHDLKPTLMERLKEPYFAFLIRRAARRRATMETRSGADTRAYWTQPNDGYNEPQTYVETETGRRRSQGLVDIMQRLVPADARILEIGCNAGRNLHHLQAAGFTNLSAIEISDGAIAAMETAFPETRARVTLHRGSMEDVLPAFGDGEFDVVFTMAVLQHLHPDSEWVFDHIVRVARRHVVTMEVEDFPSWRHFPRSYRSVFESRGMTQLRRLHNARIFGKA